MICLTVVLVKTATLLQIIMVAHRLFTMLIKLLYENNEIYNIDGRGIKDKDGGRYNTYRGKLHPR